MCLTFATTLEHCIKKIRHNPTLKFTYMYSRRDAEPSISGSSPVIKLFRKSLLISKRWVRPVCGWTRQKHHVLTHTFPLNYTIVYAKCWWMHNEMHTHKWTRCGKLLQRMLLSSLPMCAEGKEMWVTYPKLLHKMPVHESKQGSVSNRQKISHGELVEFVAAWKAIYMYLESCELQYAENPTCASMRYIAIKCNSIF